MRLPIRCFLASSAALYPSLARACTVCDSHGGQQLRAGLFNGHFTHTLLLVAAPVPLLIAAVLLLHHVMPSFALADVARPDLDPPEAPQTRNSNPVPTSPRPAVSIAGLPA